MEPRSLMRLTIWHKIPEEYSKINAASQDMAFSDYEVQLILMTCCNEIEITYLYIISLMRRRSSVAEHFLKQSEVMSEHL